jgi:hypothetical protein
MTATSLNTESIYLEFLKISLRSYLESNENSSRQNELIQIVQKVNSISKEIFSHSNNSTQLNKCKTALSEELLKIYNIKKADAAIWSENMKTKDNTSIVDCAVNDVLEEYRNRWDIPIQTSSISTEHTHFEKKSTLPKTGF